MADHRWLRLPMLYLADGATASITTRATARAFVIDRRDLDAALFGDGVGAEVTAVWEAGGEVSVLFVVEDDGFGCLQTASIGFRICSYNLNSLRFKPPVKHSSGTAFLMAAIDAEQLALAQILGISFSDGAFRITENV
jgi:hypothetical protein